MLFELLVSYVCMYVCMCMYVVVALSLQAGKLCELSMNLYVFD